MHTHILQIKRFPAPVQLIAFAACCIVVSQLRAQPAALSDPKFWFPAGPVNAMVVTNDTVYLGGDFSYVGPRTGPVALFD